MPNHVTHNCIVRGDCAAVFALAFTAPREKDPNDPNDEGTEGGFDCAKIVPKPAIYDETESSSTVSAGMVLAGSHAKLNPFSGGFEAEFKRAQEWWAKWSEAERDECVRKTLKSVEAMIRFGHADWYDWCNANWGTKWGAYNQEWEAPDAGQREWHFTFDTAWSPPEPVFDKLAAQLPEGTTIEVHWQDEGGPFGSYTITKDRVVQGAGGVRDFAAEDA